ncbi:hypothetical protein QNA08_04385 [Chelatococcus sp. SYSU_G07232]|uniref:Uncharacterized protein n=1 Tax=Chelatococcus albus TaxID=3047466 RepID=A0ABT7AER2_9HYPH|nr:hypothetical protein [Chelatococcus sp. SYSU_G07232]MDJ1157477.1 hypothetical protein [Chelatococcus sp. SYSU_G07232]
MARSGSDGRATGRALVRREATADARDRAETPPLPPLRRPLAAFLTQIVASIDGLDAQRRRRRCEPWLASARYAAVSACPPSERPSCDRSL